MRSAASAVPGSVLPRELHPVKEGVLGRPPAQREWEGRTGAGSLGDSRGGCEPRPEAVGALLTAHAFGDQSPGRIPGPLEARGHREGGMGNYYLKNTKFHFCKMKWVLEVGFTTM